MLFKIKCLSFLTVGVLALAAQVAWAAEAGPDGQRLSPDERRVRVAACKADPQKCRAEFLARREQYCKEHAERCQEIQARIEQRRAQCQADPEKCRAERQAFFEQRFKQVDTDGNGLISRAEAEKAMPRMARHFDAIDANGDGQISMEELTAARKVRHEQRRLHKYPHKI